MHSLTDLARFRVRYNTMVVFLFRPSPQVPEASLYAVKRCFKASVENIHLQRAQIEAKSVDVSWVFAQQLFMAINTVLWALSFSGLRREHSRPEVTRDLKTALDAIFWASTKWPGVESALTLYTALVATCLKAYDGDAEASYGVASPANRVSATSPSSLGSPPALANTPSSINTTRPVTGSNSNQSFSRPQSLDPDIPPPTFQALDPLNASAPPTSGGTGSHLYAGTSGSQLNIPSPQFSQASFETNGFFHPLPSPLPYGLDQTVQQSSLFSHMLPDSTFMISGGATEEQFVPYFTLLDPPMQMEGITLTQQEELMQTFETYDFGTPPNLTSQK
jgi:hypothetical protein